MKPEPQPGPTDDCCRLAPGPLACPELRPAKGECPRCGGRLKRVSAAHVMHQVSAPVDLSIAGEYGFCPASGCDVVYVGDNAQVFGTAKLRNPPAYKTRNDGDLLCYCFEIRGNEILGHGAEDLVKFVGERIRTNQCACDVLNPSAGCCLGSIARYRRDLRA